MSGKILLTSPVTQSREAVKSLITYHNHGQEPQKMPDFYRLSGEMVLVLNNKKDAYYVTTPKSCSCPSATYRPGSPCKHQRKYFPQPKKSQAEIEAESDAILAAHHTGAKRLARPPDESLIPRGGFKPFDTLPGEEKEAKASSTLSAIDCLDTTPQDVAYWSIQEDKTMWPAEA
jgi:hypothetical protein